MFVCSFYSFFFFFGFALLRYSTEMKIRSFNLIENGEHVYHAHFTTDGKYLACGSGNGSVSILNGDTLERATIVASPANLNELPCTFVKWFPSSYRLVSSSCGGAVFGWKWDGVELLRVSKADEDKNEILAIEIAADGKSFLTAGSDRVIRMYSDAFELLHKFEKGVTDSGMWRPSHVNRIFSVRFISPTLFVSAGWESPIQIWNTKTGSAEHQLFGTKAASDCLEPIPNTCMVLASSAQEGHQLHLYDCVSVKLLDTESARLSAKLPKEERIIVSRLDPSASTIWTISSQTLFVISFTTGEVVATAKLPATAISIEIDPTKKGRAVVCCHKGIMLLAQL